MKRIAGFLAPIALTLGIMSSSAFASAHASAVHAQKAVGPYRVVLQVGPAEKMSMHRKGATGEVMLGGKMASCAEPGSHMGGMSMGSTTCNRHVELHVYDRKSGRVVTKAHVSISLYTSRTRKTIQVPIMSMVGAAAGSNDLHYGNNIYAAAGHYTIAVHINQIRTTFSLHLT